MKNRALNVIFIILTLLFIFSCCDCWDECEKYVILKFDDDTTYGFNKDELSQVYIIRLNKNTNNKIDSFCFLNQNYNVPGSGYCTSPEIIVLPQNEYDYLIRTKNGYEYLIKDINITSTTEHYSVVCSCTGSVKRNFKINGQQYLDRENYFFHGDLWGDSYIYLKK